MLKIFDDISVEIKDMGAKSSVTTYKTTMGMITSEGRLIKEYQRRKDDKDSGRAISALARKNTLIVFIMLSKRERFNPDLMRYNDEQIQQTA